MSLLIAILFLSAFSLCYILVPLLERFGRSKGYVTGHAPKKIDARCIPYFGGVAMFLVFLAVLLAGYGMLPLQISVHKFFFFLVAAGSIVGFGLYDDVKELSPAGKLICQGIVAFIVVSQVMRTEIIYLPPVLNACLSVLWIVAMANAMNLLDILDGLAGGISIISLVTFFLFGLITGNYFVVLVSSVSAAVVMAFLRYNLPPARIFMGDAGSQFLGFVLALMAIELSLAPAGREIGLVIPVVILAVPLFDLFFVVIMRLKQKKSIFLKSNDHFVFRMLQSGMSNKTIVTAMVLVNIAATICAVLIYRVSNRAGSVLFMVLIGSLSLYGLRLGKLETNQ